MPRIIKFICCQTSAVFESSFACKRWRSVEATRKHFRILLVLFCRIMAVIEKPLLKKGNIK